MSEPLNNGHVQGSLRAIGPFEKRKALTRDLVRKSFEKNSAVFGAFGLYCAKTASGGLVVITPNKLRLIYGADDAYESMVSLAGMLTPYWRAHGSREFLLSCTAHAEALGVRVLPDFRNRKAALKRWLIALGIGLLGCLMLPNETGQGDNAFQGGMDAFLFFLLTARVVFLWMKHRARREEQRELETSGFTFPRETQGASFADEDDLREGGLL
jgi:hypothetical protein